MYLVLNNKMFLDVNDMLSYRNKLNELKVRNTKLIVCPSYIFIPYFRGNNYYLGSQDVSSKESGSFTGEVSSSYLKAFNVSYSLVNHFERGMCFHEGKNESVDKINNLHKYNIIPILCITTEEYMDYDNIKNDIDEIYSKIDKDKEIILAYESSRAIREGVITDFEGLKNTVLFIKKYVKDNYNKDIEVIYGGSVNNENVKFLTNLGCLDGFIMGKNSIYPDKVMEVLTEVENG